MRATFLGTSPKLTPLAQPPRIGLCRTPQWPQATAATQDALETAGRHLATAGARVEEVTLPAEFDRLADAHVTIQIFEGARCCAYELTQHAEQLSANVRRLLEPGKTLPYADYQAALGLAATCRHKLDAIFATHDVLLLPSAPGEAPVGLQATGDPIFNRLWTLLHTPAINLPGLVGPQGLPVGVQAIAPVRTL